MLLLGFSIIHGESERILGMSGVTFGALLILGGFAVYALKSAVTPTGWIATTIRNQRKAA
jgi:hypothetical protein